jgi:hypothetical protein
MIDTLLRNLRLVGKADAIIANIWLHLTLRRTGLLAFAALIAVFGLAMLNIAGFYALEPIHGAVSAAVRVGLADFVIAAVVMVLASQAKPGPELAIALELRQVAIEALQADAAELQAGLEGLRRDVQGARQQIVGALHNPLDAATRKLLVPAVTSLLRAHRSKGSP